MNAHLAVRAGIIGTIVNGAARDILEISRLDYTVFAKGYASADVKGTATVESFQKPIVIQGVRIEPGDIIFADICGIAVIPKNAEKDVIRKAVRTVRTEKNILGRILDDEETSMILEKEGEF